MNELRRLDRVADKIDLAKEIVSRHVAEFPSFITDFDVTLGYSDGEPALFVLYKTIGENSQWPIDQLESRADAYLRLDSAVLPELINAFDDAFPYSYLVPDWEWGNRTG